MAKQANGKKSNPGKASFSVEATEYLNRVLESAVAPLELLKQPVMELGRDEPYGYFTVLRINSLDMGALYPAQYRITTNRNAQSVKLATWALRQLSQWLPRQKDVQRVSFYCPVKMLLRGNLEKLLEAEAKRAATYLSRLSIELSGDLLYEDAEVAAACMDALRKHYGVHFLLSEYGHEYCPVLRLPSYPVDAVLLDSSIDSEQVLLSPAVSAAVKTAKTFGKKILLDTCGDRALISAAKELGVDFEVRSTSDSTWRG